MSLIVIETQRKLGLTIDGIVGEKTKAAVNEALRQGKITQAECDALYCADPNDDRITKNIRLGELTASVTAKRLGIDNTPPYQYRVNLIASAMHLWQPARDLLGVPIHISSGFRCDKLNRAVGGSRTSAHSVGFAIDFTAPNFGNTRKIATFLVAKFREQAVGFDQLILEFPDSPSSWIHLGYKSPSGAQRGQVLTAKKVGGKTVYVGGV